MDEAHNFAAPLFITKKRSQLVEALYGLIKNNPAIHVLLLTATPLTNDPASIHTLLTYVGHYTDWKSSRDSLRTGVQAIPPPSRVLPGETLATDGEQVDF